MLSESVSQQVVWSPHTLRYTHGTAHAVMEGRSHWVGPARCGVVWCGVVLCGVVPSSMRQQIQCPTTPEKDHVHPGWHHITIQSSRHAPSVDHSFWLSLALSHHGHSGRQPYGKRSIGRYAARWLSRRFCREWEHRPATPHTRRSRGRAVSRSASRSLSPCMVAGRDSKTGQTDTEGGVT